MCIFHMYLPLGEKKKSKDWTAKYKITKLEVYKLSQNITISSYALTLDFLSTVLIYNIWAI